MQKVMIVALTMFCLVGASSLTMADDFIKGEMDKMKAEKDAMKTDVKSEQEAM